MATDDFAATNNPLASPWESVSGMGTMESAGGVAFVSTHDVDSAMVYSTSSVQSSQAKIIAYVAGSVGPALINPSNGNGYSCARADGGDSLIIIKHTAGVFDGDNTVLFTTAVNDVIRLYINGSNQVVVSVNGTDRNTWSDTTHRTGLKPGIRGENEGDTLDDWTDGDAGVTNATANAVGASTASAIGAMVVDARPGPPYVLTRVTG